MTVWKIGWPMYGSVARSDHAELMQRIIRELQARGFAEPVEALPNIDDLEEFWRRPDMLIGQSCGYPLVMALNDDVRVLGTPRYDFPWCDGHRYRSLLIVHADANYQSIGDLHGGIAAINQWHSHSGMNAFRLAIAPHARAGRYFARTIVSGSHLESLRLLQRAQVDVAAVDCVTCGYLRLHQPETLRGLRVLATSEAMPGLPLLASRYVDERVCSLVRAALSAALRPSRFIDASARLRINGFAKTTLNDYAVIAHAERRAVEQGYPILA